MIQTPFRRTGHRVVSLQEAYVIVDGALPRPCQRREWLGIISAMNANAEWLRDQIHELRKDRQTLWREHHAWASPFVDEVARLSPVEGPRCAILAPDPRKCHEILD